MNYCRIDVFMLAENIKNKTQSQHQLRLCFGLSEKICKERNAHCVYTPLFFDLTGISVKAFRDGIAFCPLKYGEINSMSAKRVTSGRREGKLLRRIEKQSQRQLRLFFGLSEKI